jgi:hypothetical protein
LQIVVEFIPDLFSGQVEFLEAVLYAVVLFAWLVVAVVVGWLLHSVVIIVRAWRHDKSKPSA